MSIPSRLIHSHITETADCVSGDVRINEVTSGTSMTGEISGGVDICTRGQWMATCDETFGVPEAMVTCRQLGYAAESKHAGRDALHYVREELCVDTRNLFCPS